MHTFVTMREAETLDGLSDEADALDRAALQAIAFHEPKRLKEESIRHRRRVEQFADPDGKIREQANAVALRQGEAIIQRVST